MDNSLYPTRLRGEVRLNMTAMIDVIFILITFFMLICRSIGQENYKLDIPDNCAHAVLADQADQGAVTVSVFTKAPEAAAEGSFPADVSESSAEVVYAVRARIFDPRNPAYQQDAQMLITEMTQEITHQVQQKGDNLVHLRADKNLTYGDVQPVLLALSRARVKTVQLAVHRAPINSDKQDN